MIIRKIKRKDNPHLAKMIRDVFEEFDAPRQGTVYSDPTTDKLYELFLTRGSVLWVSEEDGKTVGCCGIYPTEGLGSGRCELVKFYLAGTARGKGTGKSLLQHSIKSASKFGYSSVYLESLPHFSRAINMYECLGFERVEEPLGQSGHTGCSIWMLKEL